MGKKTQLRRLVERALPRNQGQFNRFWKSELLCNYTLKMTLNSNSYFLDSFWIRKFKLILADEHHKDSQITLLT